MSLINELVFYSISHYSMLSHNSFILSYKFLIHTIISHKKICWLTFYFKQDLRTLNYKISDSWNSHLSKVHSCRNNEERLKQLKLYSFLWMINGYYISRVFYRPICFVWNEILKGTNTQNFSLSMTFTLECTSI